MNPYGGCSGLVVGLMGASWMLAELIDVENGLENLGIATFNVSAHPLVNGTSPGQR